MARSQAVSTAQVGAAPFFAGKNKIINGDFNINQRAFSSTTTSTTYGFDRWQLLAADGTSTYSAQTFTAGSAPVAGYESINFARLVSTGQTLTSAQSRIVQKIEDVRTFAGQTVTVSFWAKASTGTPNVAVNLTQNFGSGGSASVTGTGTKLAITSSWARYSITFSVASISGKTIGSSSFLLCALWTSAGSDFNSSTDSLGIQTATIDFWGVQVESGSVATAFQTATGTLAGELAACQRYYIKLGGNSASEAIGSAYATSTTTGRVWCVLPVQLRTAPSALDFSTLAFFDGGSLIAISTATIDQVSNKTPYMIMTTAGSLTANRPMNLHTNNNTAGYLAFSAEL